MKCCTIAALLVGAAVGATGVSLVAKTGAEPPKDATHSAPKMQEHAKPSAQPADHKADPMGDMAHMGELTKEHEMFKQFVGKWNGKLVSIDPMSGKEETSDGVETYKLDLGGRLLRSEWKGTYMTMPFEGLGYMSFNSTDQQWTSMWFDTMSTQWMEAKGAYNAEAKSWTLRGNMPSPMGSMPVREVTTIKSEDEHTFEMFVAGPDGAEQKMMTITYTRVK